LICIGASTALGQSPAAFSPGRVSTPDAVAFTPEPLVTPDAVVSPDTHSSGIENYQAITAQGRVNWFTISTIGPASLAGGVFSSGFGTLFHRPSGYDTRWDGFGERYGMRLTGISVGNAMEAGLGSLWGEDPRYFRSSSESFRGRMKNVVKMTFFAVNRNGQTMPAYARYIAIPGNNFLSNTWRDPSEANASSALIRTGLGFLGRLSGNAFEEFWPDVKNRVFHHDRRDRTTAAIQ